MILTAGQQNHFFLPDDLQAARYLLYFYEKQFECKKFKKKQKKQKPCLLK